MTVLTINSYAGVGPVFGMSDMFDSNATLDSQTSTLIVYRNSANYNDTGVQNALHILGTGLSYNESTGVGTGTVTGFELRSQDGTAVLASVGGVSISFTTLHELLYNQGGSGSEAGFGASLFGSSDSFAGGSGSDNLASEAGSDVLDGGAGNDTLNAGEGDDTVLGGAGADSTNGGAGSDLVDGGAGRDTLTGNLGDDTLVAHGDGDLIDGSDGLDIVDYGALTAGFALNLSVALAGNAGIAGIGGDTLRGIEGASGTAAGDTLTGDIEDNLFTGRGGNDFLYGGEGSDVLVGGVPGGAASSGGGDWLDGGLGNDRLDGTGTAYVFAIGGDGDDSLIGGDGFDWLDGGAGEDDFTAGTTLTVASYLS